MRWLIPELYHYRYLHADQSVSSVQWGHGRVLLFLVSPELAALCGSCFLSLPSGRKMQRRVWITVQGREGWALPNSYPIFSWALLLSLQSWGTRVCPRASTFPWTLAIACGALRAFPAASNVLGPHLSPRDTSEALQEACSESPVVRSQLRMWFPRPWARSEWENAVKWVGIFYETWSWLGGAGLKGDRMRLFMEHALKCWTLRAGGKREFFSLTRITGNWNLSGRMEMICQLGQWIVGDLRNQLCHREVLLKVMWQRCLGPS